MRSSNPPFVLSLVFLFLFCLSFCSASSPLVLPWCSGTSQFNNVVSSVRWESVDSTSSTVTYSFCSRQSRDIALLDTGHLHSDARIDLTFNLCSSRMECVQKSMSRTVSNGLFCINGTHKLQFPIPAEVEQDNTKVGFELINTKGERVAQFCINAPA